jgi:hypothetical protein
MPPPPSYGGEVELPDRSAWDAQAEDITQSTEWAPDIPEYDPETGMDIKTDSAPASRSIAPSPFVPDGGAGAKTPSQYQTGAGDGSDDKGGFNWLWLLAAGAGAYFLLSGKKKKITN